MCDKRSCNTLIAITGDWITVIQRKEVPKLGNANRNIRRDRKERDQGIWRDEGLEKSGDMRNFTFQGVKHSMLSRTSRFDQHRALAVEEREHSAKDGKRLHPLLTYNYAWRLKWKGTCCSFTSSNIFHGVHISLKALQCQNELLPV